MSAQDTSDQQVDGRDRKPPVPTVSELLAVAAAVRTLSTPPAPAAASRPAEHPGRDAA